MMTQNRARKFNPKTWLVVGGIYLGLLMLLEGAGQAFIYWNETKRPSGLFGEEILSHEVPVIGFGLKRNIERKIAHWSVKTNAFGFRDSAPLPKEKPADEYRIFVVGGSTVFGWGVEERESIPNRLQDLIDQAVRRAAAGHKKIRVINAGVPWYASWHESALVFFRIFELAPDWIIVLDGLNDTANAMAPTWTPIADGFVDSPTRIAYERRREGEKASSPFLEFLKLSPTFRYFHAKWKNHAALAQGVPHPEVWDQYVGYLNRLKVLCDARDVRLSLFFQPVMVVDKKLIWTEVITDGTSMKNPEFAEKFRQLYLAGEKRALAESRLRITSLRSAFKTHEGLMYIDGLHYTAEGNDILAHLIFDRALAPWIRAGQPAMAASDRRLTSP